MEYISEERWVQPQPQFQAFSIDIHIHIIWLNHFSWLNIRMSVQYTITILNQSVFKSTNRSLCMCISFEGEIMQYC